MNSPVGSTVSLRRLVPGLLLCMLLAGCATELVKQVDRNVDQNFARSTELARQAAQGRPRVQSESRSAVERVDGIWLPFRRLSDISDRVLAKEAANRRITVSRDFRNIQEVAERITLLTGIPVKVAPDALVPFVGVPLQAQTGAPPLSGAPGAPGTAGNTPPPLPPITGPAGAPQPYAVQPSPTVPPGSVPLSYDGPLSGFLDAASARFGVSWEWSDQAISVFRYKMSVFTITAQTMSAVMKDMSDTMKSVVQKIS